MGSLGTTPLIALFLVVAAVAALCGFFAAAVTRRKARRARRVFLVGVFFGFLAAEIVHGRRRGLTALTDFRARALSFAASPVRSGLARQRARQLRM